MYPELSNDLKNYKLMKSFHQFPIIFPDISNDLTNYKNEVGNRISIQSYFLSNPMI